MLRKLFGVLFIGCWSLAPLFPQNVMSMDTAIDDFVREFSSQFSSNRKIAVIAFETDRNDLSVHFIDTVTEKLLARGRNSNIDVYERGSLEYIQRELDFSLSGYVSDDTAQRIGHFIGADTVIYGALRSGSGKDEYRMTITAADTESARILSQRNYAVRLGYDAHLWTIGASAGTSFYTPLIIGTIRGTLAPFGNSFLELGVDAGFISADADVTDYFSIHPFAHYAYFLPFSKGGWYAGAGIGYLYSKKTGTDISERHRIIAFEIMTGFNLFDMLDISYTVMTDFKGATNKFSVGYTYRFK